jgi:hypothetical protein
MRVCVVVLAAVGMALAAQAVPVRGDGDEGTEADRVARFIGQLGDDDFERREAASDALDAVGHPALGALRQAVASSDDAEVRLRGQKLIEAITARPAPPPAGATVLFDGKTLAGWTTRAGREARWEVRDGYLEVAPGDGGDIMTKEEFGPDFRLHVEFWLPLMADKTGQARANSGVYLQGRYEVQVLDSYGNETGPDGSVGALYGLLAPSREAQKTAVKPPEQWNACDITFQAPRVDGLGAVTRKGKVSVALNGVKITEGEFDRVGAGALGENHLERGPVLLQDHGCKVRFRSIWLQPTVK